MNRMARRRQQRSKFNDVVTLDRKSLPTRSEITGILGPPNPKTVIEPDQLYDYQLKNHADPEKMIAVKIAFDGSGNRIQRIKVKYLRYNLEADLSREDAVQGVEIFDLGETRNEVQSYKSSKTRD
jgi:hypothetical protein